MFQQNKMVQKR